MRLTLIILFLLIALIACGDPAPPTANRGLTRPTQEEPVADVVQGEALPGRLLFVRRGTIWLWEQREGRVLLGKGEAWQPTWSPNGTQIAYVQRGESYSDVLLTDAAGTLIKRLTNNSSREATHSHERIYTSQWAFYPTWSPDGRRITMAAQYGPPVGSPAFEYPLTLYTMPAAGGTREQIYGDDNAHCGSMAYDPEGSVLVFTHASTNAERQQQLYRLVLSNDFSAPFPGAPQPSYDPTFSPDGNWLAFAASDNGHTDIWVLPANVADGSNPTPRRLTNLGAARAPAFSPDGQMLAFLSIPAGKSGFELWVADVTTDANGTLRAGEPRQITRDLRLDADSGLSWAP